MVEEGPEKKRRSRFDVLPTEQPVPQQPESNSDATSLASTTQQHHIFNPSSGINGLGYEPSLDSQIASWYQLPAPLQSESVLPDFLKVALANITRVNGEGNPSDGQPYVSVIDVRFKNRLERAMEKNLSYIERKDREALEIIANGGVIGELSANSKVHSYGMPFRVQEKAGIGANPTVAEAKVVKTESISVYVSNLPKDISEEEIDILFAPQGKIKKIKLYTDANGVQKGDCLVTFNNPDSATLACLKLNKLDIGDGHIISVVKADFGNKTNPVEKQSFVKADSSHDMVHDGGMHFMKATTGGLHTVEAMDSKLKQSLQASHQEILQFIPPECEADKHALVVIFNAYDALRADNDDSYVESIETDILLLCCNYGKINFIQLFQAPSFIVDRTLSAEKTQPHGCVAVSFDSIMSASECTKAVDGMSFNNTALRTNLLIGAGLVDQEKNSTVSELSIDVLNDQLQPTENTAIEIANPLLEDVTADSTYIAEAESVEDFLNSLL